MSRPGSAERVRALDWLAARYPVPPAEYDREAAVDLLGLREQGYTAPDVLAWLMPSREAAEMWARATRVLWGRRAWVAVDGAGQVVQVTDLRGEAFAAPGAGGTRQQEGDSR